jgi:hypothetical protein
MGSLSCPRSRSFCARLAHRILAHLDVIRVRTGEQDRGGSPCLAPALEQPFVKLGHWPESAVARETIGHIVFPLRFLVLSLFLSLACRSICRVFRTGYRASILVRSSRQGSAILTSTPEQTCVDSAGTTTIRGRTGELRRPLRNWHLHVRKRLSQSLHVGCANRRVPSPFSVWIDQHRAV